MDYSAVVSHERPVGYVGGLLSCCIPRVNPESELPTPKVTSMKAQSESSHNLKSKASYESRYQSKETTMMFSTKVTVQFGDSRDPYKGYPIRSIPNSPREERDMIGWSNLWSGDTGRHATERELKDWKLKSATKDHEGDREEPNLGRAIMNVLRRAMEIHMPMPMYLRLAVVDEDGRELQHWTPGPNEIFGNVATKKCPKSYGVTEAYGVVNRVLLQGMTVEDVQVIGLQVPIGIDQDIDKKTKGKLNRGQLKAFAVQVRNPLLYKPRTPRVVVQLTPKYKEEVPKKGRIQDSVEISIQVLRAQDDSLVNGTEFIHVEYTVRRRGSLSKLTVPAKDALYRHLKHDRGIIQEQLIRHERVKRDEDNRPATPGTEEEDCQIGDPIQIGEMLTQRMDSRFIEMLRGQRSPPGHLRTLHDETYFTNHFYNRLKLNPAHAETLFQRLDALGMVPPEENGREDRSNNGVEDGSQQNSRRRPRETSERDCQEGRNRRARRTEGER